MRKLSARRVRARPPPFCLVSYDFDTGTGCILWILHTAQESDLPCAVCAEESAGRARRQEVGRESTSEQGAALGRAIKDGTARHNTRTRRLDDDHTLRQPRSDGRTMTPTGLLIPNIPFEPSFFFASNQQLNVQQGARLSRPSRPTVLYVRLPFIRALLGSVSSSSLLCGVSPRPKVLLKRLLFCITICHPADSIGPLSFVPRRARQLEQPWPAILAIRVQSSSLAAILTLIVTY